MGLWQISKLAWRDAFEAMRRNASLFTVAYIVLLVLETGYNALFAAPVLKAVLDGQGASGATLRLLPGSLVLSVLTTVVIAPCAVVVHRSVLLGEATAGRSERDVRRWGVFAGWLLLLGALGTLPSLLQALMVPAGVGTRLLLLVPTLGVAFVAIFVSVRLLLVFPAVATDVAAPWRLSWTLTRGHWWSIAWAVLFNTLGIGLLFVVPMGVVTALARTPLGVLGSVVQAALHLLSVSVLAALASYLFRKYEPLPDAASPWGVTPAGVAVS